jgi:hypothetical protein
MPGRQAALHRRQGTHRADQHEDAVTCSHIGTELAADTLSTVPDPHPRRTYALLWTGQFFAIAGLTVVVPLLPFYLASFGLKAAEVALWLGLTLMAPAVTQALTGPFWGGWGTDAGVR